MTLQELHARAKSYIRYGEGANLTASRFAEGVLALIEQHARSQAMLKSLEWIVGEFDEPACPVCLGDRWRDGHEKGCSLAALLEKGDTYP